MAETKKKTGRPRSNKIQAWYVDSGELSDVKFARLLRKWGPAGLGSYFLLCNSISLNENCQIDFDSTNEDHCFIFAEIMQCPEDSIAELILDLVNFKLIEMIRGDDYNFKVITTHNVNRSFIRVMGERETDRQRRKSDKPAEDTRKIEDPPDFSKNVVLKIEDTLKLNNSDLLTECLKLDKSSARVESFGFDIRSMLTTALEEGFETFTAEGDGFSFYPFPPLEKRFKSSTGFTFYTPESIADLSKKIKITAESDELVIKEPEIKNYPIIEREKVIHKLSTMCAFPETTIPNENPTNTPDYESIPPEKGDYTEEKSSIPELPNEEAGFPATRQVNKVHKASKGEERQDAHEARAREANATPTPVSPKTFSSSLSDPLPDKILELNKPMTEEIFAILRKYSETSCFSFTEFRNALLQYVKWGCSIELALKLVKSDPTMSAEEVARIANHEPLCDHIPIPNKSAEIKKMKDNPEDLNKIAGTVPIDIRELSIAKYKAFQNNLVKFQNKPECRGDGSIKKDWDKVNIFFRKLQDFGFTDRQAAHYSQDYNRAKLGLLEAANNGRGGNKIKHFLTIAHDKKLTKKRIFERLEEFQNG